ncbi:hypothetical protein [Paenibacillus lautus]|uniref:hypothetical protein n=1 Tax=Paenibacillus lautus TaxID=1401 RepID=UPI003D2E21E3
MKPDSWSNLLNPNILKANLVKTSMFITSFELLKDNIINHLKSLYSDGHNIKEGLILNENYQLKVLARAKSPLYASLGWYKENKAIDQEDIEQFNRIKDYRNKLTHEMADSIFKGIDEKEYYSLFLRLIQLFEKIDRWWIINFELAIDDDIDMELVDTESIQSGPVLMLKVMFDIVTSDNEESWKYYNDFVETYKK